MTSQLDSFLWIVVHNSDEFLLFSLVWTVPYLRLFNYSVLQERSLDIWSLSSELNATQVALFYVQDKKQKIGPTAPLYIYELI